ncbi:MAG TPA: sigma factor-like helix-turn-helix DNA-binding protein [Acidobacteriota bacterium]|nr:sigma factor-like helix-turn-helix DNA-binding protein [Acidobacteriota bacterium]
MNKRLTAKERAKLHQGILKALDSMPAQLRRIFVLNRYRNLSSRELAKLMNLKPEQTSVLLESAHESFSHHLRSTVPVPPMGQKNSARMCCN